MNKTIQHLLKFTFLLSVTAAGFFALQAFCFFAKSRQGTPATTCAFVAGRSGGHIIPARTIATEYKHKNPKTKTLFFSTSAPLDLKLLANRHEVDYHIAYPLDNIPRNVGLVWYLLKMLMTAGHAYTQLVRAQARETITTGGYIALPVTSASWAAGIPVTLYELNATPGSAARLVHIIATTTKCPFASAQTRFIFPSKTVFAPYPIRFTSHDLHPKAAARAHLGIDDTKHVVAIIGGSQGSHFFNTHLPTAIEKLKKENDLFIIQQTGAADVDTVKLHYQKLNIPTLIFAFRPDIEYIYQAADICISRAGAGSIFELLFFKRPTIVIPLETAVNDHQLDNACALVAEHPNLFSLLRQSDIEKKPRQLTTIIARHLAKN